MPAETADLRGEVAELRQRLDEIEPIVREFARRGGFTVTVDVPTPVVRATVGLDPIQDLRDALAEQRAKGRVSWDQAIDHVPAVIFAAATKQFALTVGRSSGGGRSVNGFKEFVMKEMAPCHS
jgi:hypothetical protein